MLFTAIQVADRLPPMYSRGYAPITACVRRVGAVIELGSVQVQFHG
jgi:hypothetical protein